MKQKYLIVIAVVFVSASNHSSAASVVTLRNFDDTYIDGSTILGSNNNNFGANGFIQASRNAHLWAESLLRVNDIFGSGESQVPQNATISSATLHLWLDVSWGSEPNLYSLYQLATDWNEATVTSNLFGRVLTHSSGIAVDTVAGPTVNPFHTNTEYIFDVTSSVLIWQSGTRNDGWGLTAGTARNVFFSSEAGSEALRPYLRVSYIAVPEPNSITPLGFAGSGMLLIRKRRPGTRGRGL